MNSLQLLLLLFVGLPFSLMVLYTILGIVKVIYTISK